MERIIIGKCPSCGADVVKVRNGYRCTTSLADGQKCNFYLFSLAGNRRFSDAEAAQLLRDGEIMLDGFSTKEGKVFSSVLTLKNDGKCDMNSVVGTCPKCGGNVHVGKMAFNCSNYNRPGDPCAFSFWRNTAGHDVSLREAREILSDGRTAAPVPQFNDVGDCAEHVLGLSQEKDKLVRL